MSTVSLFTESRAETPVSLQPRAASAHLPRQLSDTEFVVLRGAGPNHRVAAGEVLFRKGEIGRSMYAIETGQVRIEFGDGMPHKLLGPREYFGELALFIGNHARVATAVAHTSCSLRLIEFPAFDHLLESEPAILAQFMRRSFAYLVASEQQLIAHLKRRNEDLLVTLDSLRQTQTQLSTANRLVRTDELTGLTNRRGLYQFLDKLDEQRVAGTELSLLLIDLDNFKHINDEYGHLAGDEVLRAVANEVSSVAHPCDLPARLGGDEFALLAQLSDPANAAALAARIVETISELHFPSPLAMLNVTVSIGVSHCSESTDWSNWYSQADAALYRAKGEGGGTWSLHA
ncbi:MAG TPA: GGDEF domain-containing protein [Rudaea sp.]|nr:GGDEF domain-containing protein [Rudaea sp.]